MPLSQKFSRTVNARGQTIPGASFTPAPQFGDGLFETILVVSRQVVNRERHLARLLRGLERLDIPVQLPVVNDLVDSLLPHLAAEHCYRLRLQISRSQASSYTGYHCATPNPEITLTANPIADPSPASAALMLADVRLPKQPALAGIKHCSRLEYVMAGLERSRAANALDEQLDDMLLLDSDGAVIETTTANLFVQLDGRWYTPPLDDVGVAGTVRAYLLEEGFAEIGLSCELKTISLDNLVDARAVFLCNALKGVVAVRSIRLAQDRVSAFAESPELVQIQELWFSRLRS